MATDLIGQAEIEGSLVAVIHATDTTDDTASPPTAETDRTVLGQASKEDLSLAQDEDTEDFRQAIKRRTKRYRTGNTIDAEASFMQAVDGSQLADLGIVDADGKLTSDTSDRRWNDANEDGSTEFLEFAFFKDEPDFSSIDVEADSEALVRMGGIEIASPELDPSGTPPSISITAQVEGDVWLNYGASSS